MTRKRTGQKPLYLSLIVAVIGAFFLAGCSLLPAERSDPAPTLPEPPRTSSSVTYPVERADLYEEIQGTSVVTPTQETELYFTQSGRLMSVDVRPDDEVDKGEILASLETGELEHQLSLAEIDLEIARAYVDKTQVDGTAFDRQIQQLRAEKQAIVVKNLKERLEAARIRAPYDGVIRWVRAKVGELVKEYDPVAMIADPTQVELQMNLNRTDFDRVNNDMEALVEVDRDVWKPAKIIQLTYENPDFNATIRREERTVHLEMADPNVDLPLHKQMTTRIILNKREGTLVIPGAALREFQGRKYVRVLDGQTRREVDVKVGIRTDTRVEILEGLKEGELVIGK